MAATHDPKDTRSLHPVHAMLLAFPLALFVAALLSDLAYWSSYHVQWANFAAWLNAGGLLVGAIVLLWALIGLLRRRRRGRSALYVVLLLAMWALGFLNALVHGRDGYASMPAGLYLSAIVAALAVAAGFVGYSGLRERSAR